MKKLLLLATLAAFVGCSKSDPNIGKGPSTIPPINQSEHPEAIAPPQAATASGKTEQHGDTTISPSGLKYIDMKVGKGDMPKQGQKITVNYTGKLTDGTPFDSNVDPQFKHVEPFSTTIGVGQVIKGWDEGMISMKVGGKRRLIVPPDLGYGDQGSGKIPPGATLIFDVELLKVEDAPAQ